MKKLISITLIVIVLMFLVACEEETTTLVSDYDVWKLSDIAYDYNGDRKIDAIDYEEYLLQNSYSYWRESLVAYDYNGDHQINESDYDLYLNLLEFVGSYRITNYTYDGLPRNSLLTGTSRIYLKDLGLYFAQMTIKVELNGEINLVIPSDLATSLGDLYSYMMEASENMTITRISPVLASIDTSIILDDIEVQFSIYFQQYEGGYSTSFVIGFFPEQPTITFDLDKIIE
ncbi:MAG: hypothetical protein AB7U79_02355 [Candidatus Izemoplasmatales bacterium]